MNFAFSEDQEALRKVVKDFLNAKSDEATVRELMDTESGYDQAVWTQMAEQMGLQGLIIPEEFGGSGYSFVELIVVLEEMGRRLLCAPYFSTVVLGAQTLVHSGDDAAKAEYLPGIASGETIATLAYTEPNGRWDEAAVTATATRSGDDWTIDGTKLYVLDGHTANLIITAARTDAGVSLFAVQGDAAGLTRTALSTMDQTRKQARLEYAGVPAKLIGTDGAGWDTISTVLDLAAVALAAEQVGGGQEVLESAVQYAKDRVQFGRPIGSFQAIKHKCADMLLEVESAKSAAYYAGWCAAEMNDELPSVASLAKAYCSEAYFHAAAENIQIHGGIGFTWEHPAHLYFKRAKSSELLVRRPDLPPRAARTAHRHLTLVEPRVPVVIDRGPGLVRVRPRCVRLPASGGSGQRRGPPTGRPARDRRPGTPRPPSRRPDGVRRQQRRSRGCRPRRGCRGRGSAAPAGSVVAPPATAASIAVGIDGSASSRYAGTMRLTAPALPPVPA